jgi:hypothetical protein
MTDPHRHAELSAIAQWLAYARAASPNVHLDPAGYIGDTESRWLQLLCTVPPAVADRLLDARDDGTLSVDAIYAHLTALAAETDAAIAATLCAHVDRAERAMGDGQRIDEQTPRDAIGGRALAVVARDTGRTYLLPPARDTRQIGPWRGVPSERSGANVGQPVSGHVPRPDDRQFAALVRALDAAARKAPGRAERDRRAEIASRNRAAAPVRVTRGPGGAAFAGTSRRKRRRKRKRAR